MALLPGKLAEFISSQRQRHEARSKALNVEPEDSDLLKLRLAA
jgi:hypothetical protein